MPSANSGRDRARPEASAVRRLLAPAVAGSVVAAVFIAYVAYSAPFDSDLRAQDVEAYWSAAEALRGGENPYVAEVLPYTYAPWFAYLWVPLTFLDRHLVETVWLAILVVSVLWLALPLVGSYAGIVLALLLVPQMLEYAWIGNVDAVMLVGLATTHTRVGPLFVGLAASLKITPIVFVAVYVARGEWTRAVFATAVALALWLPAFAFDVSAFGQAGYDVTTPYSLMVFGPVAWAVGVGTLVGAVVVAAIRDRRYVLLASAVAAMLFNPRLNLYNLGYLIVPARRWRAS